MRLINIVRALGVVTVAVLLMGAGDMGWLSLCGKCISPSIVSASGLGTANAAAEARIGRAEAQDYCSNWEPGDPGCVARELANPDNKGPFRATADCTAGRIRPIDGQAYTHAGLWDASDIGAGRSKWRDASGRIVGRDNASNGLAISQQWETLCPKGLVRATAPASASARAQAAPVAGAIYSVGQSVEAKFMSGWVPAKVVRLRPGPNGAVDYEVNLANGQRGIVPARMLRAAR